MERRELLSGSVLAGMGTALGGTALGFQRSGGAQTPDNEAVSAVFLRANQKFPDYIEIGIAVWESICDWHVRHLLPIQVTRTPDGRYSMAVMLTNLVLRPEQSETFVGFGFDLR